MNNPVILNLLSMFFIFIAVATPIVNFANFKKPKFTNFLTFLSMSSLAISLFLLLLNFQNKLFKDDIANLKSEIPTLITIYSFLVVGVIALNLVSVTLYGIKHSKKSAAVKKVEEEMAKKEEKKEAKKLDKLEKKESKKLEKENKAVESVEVTPEEENKENIDS